MNKEGDHTVFDWDSEFQKFYRKVLAFAVVMKNGNRGLAEDLIQNLWVKFLLDPKKLDKLAAAKNRSAFFCQALKRFDIDRYRIENAKKRKADFLSLETDEEGNGLIKTLASKDPGILDILVNRVDGQGEEEVWAKREESLQDFVEHLPGLERDIFQLYLEDNDCDEIGEKLNLDPRVVTFELRRLKGNIKYHLTKKKKNRDSKFGL